MVRNWPLAVSVMRSPIARRLHRSPRRSEIRSTHRSRDLGADSEKLAAKPRICSGRATEAAKRIGFVSEAGPTAAG